VDEPMIWPRGFVAALKLLLCYLEAQFQARSKLLGGQYCFAVLDADLYLIKTLA
jgi:hypothetical protein